MIIDEENNNIFIVEKLNNLKNELNKDQVNLKSVQRDIKQLEKYDNTANYEYLNSLLKPEKNRCTKIPFNVPIPSCTFQLHNSFNFVPNGQGLDLFAINPWFLASEAAVNIPIKVSGTQFLTRDKMGIYFFTIRPQLTGTSDTDNMSYSGDLNQMIPDVYSQYRLVSACIEVKYIGQLDAVKGIIGGGISYLKSKNAGIRLYQPELGGEWGSRNPDYGIFGNFENIRDCYYSCENNTLEGLRMLYFPLDNSFNEFKKVFGKNAKFGDVNYFRADDGSYQYSIPFANEDCYRSGFNWIVYLLNGVKKSEGGSYRLDYYFNYECIPKAEFLNYMPVTLNVTPRISNDLFKKFIDEVQEKALQKINIY